MTLVGNVSQQDIKHFNALAEHWWNEEGELKTLHHINPTRMAFICEHVNLTDKRVLDVGCGGGVLAESLAKAGAQVTGIDMAEAALKVAKTHAASQALTIDYQLNSVESFAETHAGQFDIITCLEMLEHVPDPHDVVAACSQLLKPGGHLFFSTLNRTAKAYLTAIIGAEYVLNLLPKNTHQYDQFIKPSELSQWARSNHLHLNTLIGLHYQPFTEKATLTPDVSVNYIAYYQKTS